MENAFGIIITLISIALPVISIGIIFFVFKKTGFLSKISKALSFGSSSADDARIIKTGTPGTATILSVSEAGTTVQTGGTLAKTVVNIELQVSIPGSTAYITTTQKLISAFEVAQYQPGSVHNVMIDTLDKMKVVFHSSISGASPQQAAEIQQLDREQAQIRANGTPAKALITTYTPTGIYYHGNNPQVVLGLQILPDNEAPFDTTTKAILSQTGIAKYQPGQTIYVKYNPLDKTKVSIDHS